MRRLLLLLILVTMPPAANAQHHRNRHIGAATIGVQIINPDDFNSALTSNYKPLDNTMFAAGGMGLTLHRRFLIGADALGMLGKRNTTTDGLFNTRASGGYALIDFGYAAVHNRHLLVYPLIGVGAGGMQYAITPTTSTSFGSILANPGRSARLSSGSMLFALRGGMTYMLSNRKTPGRGMALGVRVGYVINPFDPSWRESENTSVNGGPKLTSAGPELSISLGGWR